jgi:hypothetical protein
VFTAAGLQEATSLSVMDESSTMHRFLQHGGLCGGAAMLSVPNFSVSVLCLANFFSCDCQ